MNGRVRLQITVRHCDIAVTRLVSGIDDALGIREVTYAGVLQTVELVGVREAKTFSLLKRTYFIQQLLKLPY